MSEPELIETLRLLYLVKDSEGVVKLPSRYFTADEVVKNVPANGYDYGRRFNSISSSLGHLVKEGYLEKGGSSQGNTRYRIIKGIDEEELTEISSFQSFKDSLEGFRKDFKGKRLYFRGEGGKFSLAVPSIYRKENKELAKKSNRFYSDLEVRLGDMDLLREPLPTRLARFQHYQAPTRFLDITSNPLIALFFAVEAKSNNDNNDKSDKNEKGFRQVYFYAINEDDIKYQDGHTVGMESAVNRMDQKIVYEFLESVKEQYDDGLELRIDKSQDAKTTNDKEKKLNEALLGCDKVKIFMDSLNETTKQLTKLTRPSKIFDDLNTAHFVDFVRESPRMQQQQGTFIMPKYLTGYEDDWYEAKQQLNSSILRATGKVKGVSGLMKVLIPDENTGKIKDYLSVLGVNAGTTYPDIEHYAEYLRELYTGDEKK